MGLPRPATAGHGDALFAAERLIAQIATRDRQFLVKSMMVATGDDQPRDDDHGRAVDAAIRHGAHGDAMQFLHVVLRPDFGTQQRRHICTSRWFR
jgi:hypothetical protein